MVFVPFEHGFNKPKYGYFKIYGVDDDYIYYNAINKGNKKISFDFLSEEMLEYILKSLNDYLIYCKTEA